MFFNVSQGSQEKTCDGVSLFLETFLKLNSSTVVFLFFSRFFEDTYLLEQLRTITSERGSFSRSASKISKDFQMNKCFWYILFILRFGREAHTSSLIKKLINFSKKTGNAHVALGFVCPTNELKGYSINLLNRNLFRSSHKRCSLKKGVL